MIFKKINWENKKFVYHEKSNTVYAIDKLNEKLWIIEWFML